MGAPHSTEGGRVRPAPGREDLADLQRALEDKYHASTSPGSTFSRASGLPLKQSPVTSVQTKPSGRSVISASESSTRPPRVRNGKASDTYTVGTASTSPHGAVPTIQSIHVSDVVAEQHSMRQKSAQVRTTSHPQAANPEKAAQMALEMGIDLTTDPEQELRASIEWLPEFHEPLVPPPSDWHWKAAARATRQPNQSSSNQQPTSNGMPQGGTDPAAQVDSRDKATGKHPDGMSVLLPKKRERVITEYYDIPSEELGHGT